MGLPPTSRAVRTGKRSAVWTYAETEKEILVRSGPRDDGKERELKQRGGIDERRKAEDEESFKEVLQAPP